MRERGLGEYENMLSRTPAQCEALVDLDETMGPCKMLGKQRDQRAQTPKRLLSTNIQSKL